MVVGTEESVKNKILVVSSLLESPSSILSKIIGKDDLALRPIYSDEIQAANWQIDTKYYTADVEFWILNQHNYPATQLPLSSEQLGDLCEALILVFDATKNESFEKLRAWEEFVAEYNPNVLLCVGIGKTENRSVYNEWCISNGIEFVQVDAINPAEPQEDDEDRFGGTEGKDRIIEALGTTMWANMKQKARATRGLEEQFSSMLSLAGESDDDEGLDGITTNNDNDNTNTNIPAPTFDPLNFDEDIRLARGEFKHATDEISHNLLSLQNFLKETEQQEKEGGKEGGGKGEDAGESDVNLSTEANVEHFESALTGLRRLRENAQQLPDSQRKALAAHVISMLFPDVEDWQD